MDHRLSNVPGGEVAKGDLPGSPKYSPGEITMSENRVLAEKKKERFALPGGGGGKEGGVLGWEIRSIKESCSCPIEAECF